MATVHIGRLIGEAGFTRTVAIKRLHQHFSREPEFVAMFVDEARLASRIRHPNVVSTLDVVTVGSEMLLVMDFVQGESVARLSRALRTKQSRMPIKVALSIIVGALYGLHAAHDARSESGKSLGIVHRDVSPQNILVDVDGVAKMIDFGVAKAADRLQHSREGAIKGKLPYMPPEQIESKPLDRRCDVYAASVVLWEMLTGKKLFQADSQSALLSEILDRISKGNIEPPSAFASSIPKAIDEIVARGLSHNPDDRFPTARDMAIAIEKASVTATSREVAEWLDTVCGESLRKRAERILEIESNSSISAIVPVPGLTTEAVSDTRQPQTAGEGSDSQKAVTQADTVGDAATPWGLPDTSATARPALLVVSVAVAVSLTLIASAGVAYYVLRPAASGASEAPSATAAPSAPEPAASSPEPAASSPEPAVPSPELAVSTPAASTSSAQPSRATPGTSPAVPTAKTPTPAPAATTARTAQPKVGCDPPYTFDANGVKHYKRECVK